MHVLVVLILGILVGGALGYIYGNKVKAAAQAEVYKLTDQAKSEVSKEVSKL